MIPLQRMNGGAERVAVTVRRSSRAGGAVKWAVTLGATGLSTCALDAVATAAGVALAGSHLLRGLGQPWLLAFLGATYVGWAAGLRANLSANWELLLETGTSTNVVSKAAYELVRLRAGSPRARRLASAIGYVGSELAKEAPYYAGAFAAAAVSGAVTGKDAMIFLAGTNLGAAAYEYALARATGAGLRLRAGRPNEVPDLDGREGRGYSVTLRSGKGGGHADGRPNAVRERADSLGRRAHQARRAAAHAP